MDVKAKAKTFFKKFASWYLWLNLLGMVLLLVAAFFGLKWWLASYTHHGEGIEVPDFYKMDYREATDLAEEAGLSLMVNDSTYNKELPAGCIVVQTPAKGMNVKQGRVIYVTINSLTVPRVAIPDLVDNSSYREAQYKLQSLGFRILPPKLIDGEKDWVYGIECDGRELRRGDMVARESQLTLVIGNGAYGRSENVEVEQDFESEFDNVESQQDYIEDDAGDEDPMEIVTDEDME